jgi:hypothetical protein
MNAKRRIKQLEKARVDNGTQKIIFMVDTPDKDIVKFDGVEMTRKEADTKAAALPESAMLIYVTYASNVNEVNE